MMNLKSGIILFSFIFSSSLFAGTWIEDSLGFAFEFPRGWTKSVQRYQETARIQFAKTNREAVLQIDAVRRTKDYDLDRFIEETMDTFLKRYPDLKVVKEKHLANEFSGFDESTFVVIHYTENKTLISNRFLFHKTGGSYFVIQAKTPRALFSKYVKDLDLVMKSFRREPRTKLRWRNDSLAYLDPTKDERIIQYVSITIRPIDSFKQNSNQTSPYQDNWLFSVEGNKAPGPGEWDATDVQKPDPNQQIKPDTPSTDVPVVIPQTPSL